MFLQHLTLHGNAGFCARAHRIEEGVFIRKQKKTSIQNFQIYSMANASVAEANNDTYTLWHTNEKKNQDSIQHLPSHIRQWESLQLNAAEFKTFAKREKIAFDTWKISSPANLKARKGMKEWHNFSFNVVCLLFYCVFCCCCCFFANVWLCMCVRARASSARERLQIGTCICCFSFVNQTKRLKKQQNEHTPKKVVPTEL